MTLEDSPVNDDLGLLVFRWGGGNRENNKKTETSEGFSSVENRVALPFSLLQIRAGRNLPRVLSRFHLAR